MHPIIIAILCSNQNLPPVLTNEIAGRVERHHVTRTLFADMTKRKPRCSGHVHGEAQPAFII